MMHLKPIQIHFPSALQKMMSGRPPARALWDLPCFLVVVMVGGELVMSVEGYSSFYISVQNNCYRNVNYNSLWPLIFSLVFSNIWNI